MRNFMTEGKSDRKVLVTGMGMITALGLDLETNWKNISEGKSGVGPITLFDASANQTRIAAQVPEEFDAFAQSFIRKRTSELMTRVTRMCYVAAKQAVAQSGIDFSQMDRDRCAVVLGVVSTANTSSEKGTTPQNRVLKSMSNAMSAWISMEYKITGPNYTVASACASSAYALGIGFDMIKSGSADVVIVGGADSIINKEEIEGFNELYALCTDNDHPEKASRPFSKNRDGFVPGEGSGVIILESETSALARKAKVYAEIAGYATTSEGYNIMAPEKDGEGIARTLQLALHHAGWAPQDVQYINAHGTSTTLNDKYETMAIKKVFSEYASNIPVSSSKSMIGHTIGAAGAIELIITVQGMNSGIMPPTINLDIPDPELDLDYIPNVARVKSFDRALSNSFAFGGHNAVVAIKKYCA
jgi:3-oxoacyl-[acyl-carrier-protein] synthase II